MDEHIEEITKVLIFKDGYYYLTVQDYHLVQKGMFADDSEPEPTGSYRIANVEYNGFEFASDAYAYLAKLQGGVPKGGYNRIGADGIPDNV